MLISFFFLKSAHARCESNFTSVIDRGEDACNMALLTRYYMGFREGIDGDESNLVLRFVGRAGLFPAGSYGLYRHSSGDMTINVLTQESCLSAVVTADIAENIWVGFSQLDDPAEYCGLLRKPQSVVSQPFFDLVKALASSQKRYIGSFNVSQLDSGEFLLIAKLEGVYKDSVDIYHTVVGVQSPLSVRVFEPGTVLNRDSLVALGNYGTLLGVGKVGLTELVSGKYRLWSVDGVVKCVKDQAKLLEGLSQLTGALNNNSEPRDILSYPDLVAGLSATSSSYWSRSSGLVLSPMMMLCR